MAEKAFLALDLGAESGRAVLGRFDGERMEQEEIHRFPNTPVRLVDGMHWDALRIFSEVKEGLRRAAEQERIASLGVDSWGVDFGLLDRDGALVSNPYYYRDPRTDGTGETAFRRMSKEDIYGITGVQFMQINTLNQLLASEDSPFLEAAETLLMMPDLIAYWLTGEKTWESTIASTTQLLDARSGGWAQNLLESMKIPARLFGEVRPPGTELGPLLNEVSGETGAEGTTVTSVASHDTASAVAAVPAEGIDFAYISSGTWSLVGVESTSPVITDEGMRANFTNEGGFGGTTRFLKNVMGLWLLQECRRVWARDGAEYSYEELARLAEEAPPLRSLVDPDHPSFLAPGDMPSRIRRFCGATGQKPPDGQGAMTRCVLESLALKYRWSIEKAAGITGRDVRVVHIVGGGVRNELLCQLTADATGLPVRCGPVEATALGNLLVQAYARGYLGSLDEMRAVVRRSVGVRDYEPRDTGDGWDDAFGRMRGFVEEAPELEEKGASA